MRLISTHSSAAYTLTQDCAQLAGGAYEGRGEGGKDRMRVTDS
jgi:hypothetical protein